MTASNIIVIGTRQSPLAVTQTQMVCDAIKEMYPDDDDDVQIEVKHIKTTGDNVLDVPLHKIGQKSLFTKELEVALLNKQVDLVVHSLKDVSTTLPDGLHLGAVLEREDPRDVLILRADHPLTTGKLQSLADLPAGTVLGTSSVRRLAQLKHMFPQLQFKDIRGNLNTRLHKLDTLMKEQPDDDQYAYDGLILAYAGVKRMGWEARISLVLESDAFVCKQPVLYAVGQGALAIECRAEDIRESPFIRTVCEQLTHKSTLMRCTAERTLMRRLEGGCSVPIGVHTSYDSGDKQLNLCAVVCSVDGAQRIEAQMVRKCNSPEQAHLLGDEVAQDLLKKGASAILSSVPRNT
ncbi:hypothetical protein MP228_005922 [Amoeboaphelidium protococcarum]|nr:hypothetical protein MP228_005922 [Amoeboaphelidium protococcarum]